MEERNFEDDLKISQTLNHEWEKVFKRIFGQNIFIKFQDNKIAQLEFGTDTTIQQKNGRKFSVECEIPSPNKVEVMASCDHLGDKPRRPFVLSYSRTGKQDNRNCFTQAVFPTTSCCDNKKFLLYKSLYSNSSISKQSYGYGLLGNEVKFAYEGRIYLDVL